jgi:hypothetical protein
MPRVLIVAEPVFARQPETAAWSNWVDVALVTASEYNKYLVTLARYRIGGLWAGPMVNRSVASADTGTATGGHRR